MYINSVTMLRLTGVALLVTLLGCSGPVATRSSGAPTPPQDSEMTCEKDADCPVGQSCDQCARGSCPECDDCVTACVPD